MISFPNSTMAIQSRNHHLIPFWLVNLLGGLQYDCNSSITKVESVRVELLNRMLVIVIQSSCLITNLLTLSSRKYLFKIFIFLVYSYSVQKCGCYQCEFYHDYTEVASNRIF